MRIKHNLITLILIQLFVISAVVGALCPTVSAVQNDTNTITSSSEFPESPMTEDAAFDWFNRADDLGPEFVPGEVLVKFRTKLHVGLTDCIVTTDIASVSKLNKRFEAKGMERIFSKVYKLELPNDADVLSVAKEYEADPNVEYAQPNYIYHYSAVPNDTEYWKQWAHEVTQAELAWNTTTGDPSVVIAILDSGVQWNHTDLAANIWNNTDEIPDNGIDDDENGYVDDIRGWDFYDNDSDPMDTYGHGTHCAGIAAAVGNNGEGVAGASWLSSIMAVRVGGAYGPTTDAIIKGIRYAANNGADIISMSFDIGGDDPTVHNEVTTAYNSNVLLVAAAGNSATYYPRYPAAWSEVVAVSATDSADDPASFTNFGDWIEVAAPGVHIYSTLPNNTYGYVSGTSMSCPYVAGVAALIKSRFPRMTNVEVRGQLGNTTDDIGEPGFDVYHGDGRVNARWAVDHTSSKRDLRLWGMQIPKLLKPGTTTTVNSTVLNFGKKNETGVSVQFLVNGSVMQEKIINNIQPYEWTTVNFSWTPQTEGWSNVTTYVVPLERPPEGYTNNNALSARVLVRVEDVVKVPEDFSTIQRAVSAANSGYTVQVSSGTYNEACVNIDKRLTLTATDPGATIIDGGGEGGPIIHIRIAGIANVSVSQFIIRNGKCGIYVDAPGLTQPTYLFSFSGNVISGNMYGILLHRTFEASIESSILTNNTYGITMVNSYGGNTINDNVISNNNRGIDADESGFTISGNIISNNGDGIYMNDCYGPFIYHNNFIDNTRQLWIYYTWSTLDDGYPSGGNYWSDYVDEDLYSGPYQNETGSDGIWDHPYVIDENNQDNYPLVNHWHAWDLLDEPWDSLGTWNTLGLVEINPAGQLHLNSTPTGTSYVEKDIGTYPAQYTIEFRKNIHNFGGEPSYLAHSVDIYDAIHRLHFLIKPTQIEMINSGGGYDTIALTTNIDTWYLWRLVVNSSGHSVKVYRDNAYVGEFTSLKNYLGHYDGSTQIWVFYSSESHDDYLKIASGLHHPDVWDLLIQPWDSISGWTVGGNGIAEIDPAGYLHMKCEPFGSKWVAKDIGAYPNDFTIEFAQTVDDFPGEYYIVAKEFWDGTHRFRIEIQPSRVGFWTSAGYMDWVDLVTEEGVEYVWRILIQSLEPSARLYRDTVFIGEFDDFYYEPVGDGVTYNYVSTLVETHDDYLKIVSGLRPPTA